MATLGTMVTNVRTNVSDQGFAVPQYFSSPEIKQAIGEAYRYYYFKLIRMAEGYFETTINLDLIANDENVSLIGLVPSFKNISQLWRYVTNGVIPLKEQQGRFIPIYTLNIAAGDAYQPLYKIRGTNIVLNPPPSAAQVAALKLDYVYQPIFPNSSSLDAFDFDTGTIGVVSVGFPTVYEINVEIRATIKILESKDAIGGVSDIQTFRNQLAELDKAFDDSSENDEYPDSVQYIGLNYRNGGYY